jgi:hypothetical protein
MFADRQGIWQVSIIGSQDRAAWYLKVTGPNAFERSYTLERAAGEQRVEVIRAILSMGFLLLVCACRARGHAGKPPLVRALAGPALGGLELGDETLTHVADFERTSMSSAPQTQRQRGLFKKRTRHRSSRQGT